VKGFALKDEFKKIGIAEMKHAEEIAERLVYLGGVPTTKPEPIRVGNTLKEMIQIDKKDEEGAIAMYRKIILLARKEGDEVTEKLFKEILADEEEHHDTTTPSRGSWKTCSARSAGKESA
jgi:bacterioferritin